MAAEAWLLIVFGKIAPHLEFGDTRVDETYEPSCAATIIQCAGDVRARAQGRNRSQVLKGPDRRSGIAALEPA